MMLGFLKREKEEKQELKINEGEAGKKEDKKERKKVEPKQPSYLSLVLLAVTVGLGLVFWLWGYLSETNVRNSGVESGQMTEKRSGEKEDGMRKDDGVIIFEKD